MIFIKSHTRNSKDAVMNLQIYYLWKFLFSQSRDFDQNIQLRSIGLDMFSLTSFGNIIWFSRDESITKSI